MASLALVGSLAGVASVAHADYAQQGPKITGGINETGNGDFGYASALSADGNTALIAAPSNSSNKGAVFSYTRSGTTWSFQAKLPDASDLAGTIPTFGTAVALSADGNTALIGAPYDTAVGFGAAFVYTRSGSTWTQQGTKLVPTSGQTSISQFGLGVALSADGNTAAIGAPQNDSNVGAGWIFKRTGTTWAQESGKLTGAGSVASPDGVFFGRSAALSDDGNTVVFGGPSDNGSVGAAWVFTRSGTTWSAQGGKLVPNDGVGAPGFGGAASMSADGNTVLVSGTGDTNASGRGAAWVFTRSGSTWSQQGSKLVPLDATGSSFFGNGALSSDGNIALIAGLNDSCCPAVGAAWIFARSGGVWSQRGPKLTGSGAASPPEFGDSVSLSDDGGTALVGGSRDNSRVGAAWVFFGTPGAPFGGGSTTGSGNGNNTNPTTGSGTGQTTTPVVDRPSPDIAAVASHPACLSIPTVLRDQKRSVTGGKVVLATQQVDDPAAPLRVSVRSSGSARIRSASFKVNGGRAQTAGPVSVARLRVGGNVQRNQITVTVTLTSGRKVVLTQFLILLKCATPVTSCKRLAGGLTMRCTSRTPLGGRRVRITASRTTREVATGTATVTGGKYTATLRSSVPLSAGRYAYKHVVTTSLPRQRYYMIRLVQVT